MTGGVEVNGGAEASHRRPESARACGGGVAREQWSGARRRKKMEAKGARRGKRKKKCPIYRHGGGARFAQLIRTIPTIEAWINCARCARFAVETALQLSHIVGCGVATGDGAIVVR